MKQNQELKIHFWVTGCIGSIKMALTVLILMYFLPTKRGHLQTALREEKLLMNVASLAPLSSIKLNHMTVQW